MKTYGGVDVLDLGISLLVVRFTPRPLYPRGKSSRWEGLRVGLDDVKKRKFFTVQGLELRPLGSAARSQWLTDYAIPARSHSVAMLKNRGSIFIVVKWTDLPSPLLKEHIS
jgi:hypothetical protein